MLLANVDHKQQLKKAYKICPDASILTLAMVCARIDRQNSYRVFGSLLTTRVAYHKVNEVSLPTPLFSQSGIESCPPK